MNKNSIESGSVKMMMKGQHSVIGRLLAIKPDSENPFSRFDSDDSLSVIEPMCN